MKNLLLLLLLTVSTSVLAQTHRQCADMPGICTKSPPGLQFAPALQVAPAAQELPPRENFAQVPVPATLALIALGLTGMVITRKRRK